MFNKENYRRIKREFTAKHLAAGEKQQARMREVESAVPEIAEINRALSETGLKIFRAALGGKDGLDARIAALQTENGELLAARGDILAHAGYPRDYLNLHYDCDICHDTGFCENGTKLCACMRRALILAGYESSGIGALLSQQTFDNFSLDYYTDPADRAVMANNLDVARHYVERFSSDRAQNLLFFGQTGLGKTHLSTAIAKALIDRGFDVVYETAQNIFSDFEDERFNRAYNSGAEEKKTDRYFECELLILDDLGAELSNQFTASCLYNLINNRMNAGKSCIISTNLSHPEIEKRYTQRVLSRLLGTYQNLRFCGRDVRMMKIRM
ncbi:MAG: ATP-binding protein [Clostridia bacterium]|nr:ATP-binding protein [Clostridia bacterium]